MNDRELLEKAAKAAGIELRWHDTDTDKPWCYIPYAKAPHNRRAEDANNGAMWNPLEDDGDALRLAVKLFLWEAVRDGYQHVDSDNDFYAATRRAIVRAAAALADAPGAA